MSVAARLLGFAALLMVVFGLAAFAGSRIDVRPGEADEEPAMADGHAADGAESDEETAMADGHAADGAEAGHASDGGAGAQGGASSGGEHGGADVRGLAVSAGGLTLDLDEPRAQVGSRFDLDFRILGEDGRAQRRFDVEHAKRMHVIVVRRDLTGFQHLHPTMRADGTWTVPVTLREPGSYRVFADFVVDGVQHTLAGDLSVDGPVHAQALPLPVATADADGYRVTKRVRGSDVSFEVTRDGRPVAVEDYLGAKGHLVALREGDLAFLHVHPHDDELAFTTELPKPGRYRLFLQFEVGGQVHTAAFTEVAR